MFTNTPQDWDIQRIYGVADENYPDPGLNVSVSEEDLRTLFAGICTRLDQVAAMLAARFQEKLVVNLETHHPEGMGDPIGQALAESGDIWDAAEIYFNKTVPDQSGGGANVNVIWRPKNNRLFFSLNCDWCGCFWGNPGHTCLGLECEIEYTIGFVPSTFIEAVVPTIGGFVEAHFDRHGF